MIKAFPHQPARHVLHLYGTETDTTTLGPRNQTRTDICEMAQGAEGMNVFLEIRTGTFDTAFS
jgi:hypothetical protein